MRASVIAPILAVAWVQAAGACSCDVPDSIAEHIRRSDAIFSGVARDTHWVVSFDDGIALLRSTKFEVYEKLKGEFANPPSVFVYVRHEGHVAGNCGLTFFPGLDYEVFASSFKKHLYSGKCDFTRLAPIQERAPTWDEYRKAISETP